MKRLFVFVPVNLLVLFLLNSFVLKEKEAGDKTTERTGSGPVNIVFKSTNGGQTWQDISKGLPENLQGDFFAKDNELYLRDGNWIYHSNSNSTAPSWKKESFLLPDKEVNIVPGKAGIFAYNFEGHFFQKTKGRDAWQPVYTNFQRREVTTVFETAGGTVFIAAGSRIPNSQLYKSTDSGKTWKLLLSEGLVGKMVESNGVLLATGAKGILRSTDDGETWKWTIIEGVVGINVENIKGGFAAITFDAESRTSRVRTSYDGGQTWQPIDADLPADYSIYSIIQVDENFFCSHPKGIFRSSDKGKTWKLLLPAIEGKVFNLAVSGNVVYALSRKKGC
jgi:photosystem II stability/assembly factor-like uncharacterized protein